MSTDEGASWRRRLCVMAIAAAGFALTLRIFWPGVMTYDAAYIYSYIAAGRAGDWQSPLMTALWGVIDPIAPGAGSMFLLIASLYWLGFAVLALALAALDRCVALGLTGFDAALGESQTLVHGTWQSADAIRAWLTSLPDTANSGDIYAVRP